MNTLSRLVCITAFSTAYVAAHANTTWSTTDYDLHAGDFDGDGKTDVLYVAKDPSQVSGIARSEASGPNASFQSWPSGYLGIPWYGNTYSVVVADFNGDAKADVLLQRNTPGDHFLLFANAQGKITAINQTISNVALGLTWSADQHRIVAGDFNFDNRADLFLQGTSPSTLNAVVLSDAAGQFTSGPAQTWSDGYLGFKWSTKDAIVYTGDFNGDFRWDLLIQARPKFVMIDYDITIPVPTYPASMNGLVRAQSGSPIFQASGSQAWSRTAFGVDWSPLNSNVVVGDFNGDGSSDVVLQGRAAGRPSYLVTGNASGAAFSTGVALASNVTWTADSYRLVAGNFDGTGGTGIYLQAVGATGVNYVANTITGGSVSTTPHDPAAGTSPSPATAAGRTAGSFAVSDTGAATYAIPIITPPGIRGVEPHLALVYNSNSPAGLVGPGWSLAGLSEIRRCNKTWAQDGISHGILLSSNDAYCLDGKRLRKTSGTYGQDPSTYQTELADFSNVIVHGPGTNGPLWFEVKGKDGLTYEYGPSTYSRVNVPGTTTPYIWALEKVRDHQGNRMQITYLQSSGTLRPVSIAYTAPGQPVGNNNYLYNIQLGYESVILPEDFVTAFVAGAQTQLTLQLTNITIQVAPSWTNVRAYTLNYAAGATTGRRRLSSVQESELVGTSTALAPTTITYQDGQAGIANPTVSTGSGATSGRANAVDINGDGKEDLVYSTVSGSSHTWWVKFATSGGFGSASSTGVVTASDAVLLDDFDADGRVDLLAPSGGVWFVLKWSGSAFTWSSTGRSVDTSTLQFVSADVDGNGLPDLVSYRSDFKFYTRLNTTTGGAVSFAATATMAYSLGQPILSMWGNNSIPHSAIRHMDFNGDGKQDVAIKYYQPPPLSQYVIRELYASFGGGFDLGAGGTASGSAEVPLPAAWNDDACTDLIFANAVRIGRCANAAATSINSVPSGVAMDWNGDGRTDVLTVPSATLFRSTGDGVVYAGSTGLTTGTGSWVVLDQNGDGLSDLALVDSASSNVITYGLHNGANLRPDLVSSITDGFGINASPTYSSIVIGNYTKGSSGAYPDPDYIGPRYVVTQLTASDGTGGSFTESFSYTAARMNVQGRGFRGFAEKVTSDSRNGLVSKQFIRTDFPFSGLLWKDEVYQPNGGPVMTRLVNTFTSSPALDSTPNNQRYFPFVSQSIQSAYEIMGAASLVTETTRVFQYDASYGNPTNITTTVTDKDASSPWNGEEFTEVLTQHFDYNSTAISSWCISIPDRTTIQRTTPGGATQTRTRGQLGQGVDYQQCRITADYVEPSSSTLATTTTFAYDSTCGNVQSVQVVGKLPNGSNMPARTTLFDFGTRCQFPISITNPLNQTTSFHYREDIGVLDKVTDPNQLVTSWVLDDYGRKTRETRPDQTATDFDYSACTAGNNYCGLFIYDIRLQMLAIERTTTNGEITRRYNYVDGLGRPRLDQMRLPLSGAWSSVVHNYDSLGRVISESVPYSVFQNGKHGYQYDLGDRVVTHQLLNAAGALDRQSTFGYSGRTRTVTDPKGYVRQELIDVRGNLRRSIDPSGTGGGGITNYGYDPFSHLTTITDTAGNETIFGFDLLGHKTSMSDPDAGNSTIMVNSLGEPVTQTDANGQVVTFDPFDALGRPTKRTEPEGATTWTWGISSALHNIGQLEKVVMTASGNYEERYAYDDASRPQTVTFIGDATSYLASYGYNNEGNIDTILYPASTGSNPFQVKYGYSYGFMSQVRDYTGQSLGMSFWTLNATDERANPIDESFGNGVRAISGFNALTGTQSYRQSGTGGSTTNLQNLAYQWDLNGNLSQRQDLRQGIAEALVHDTLNRLTQSSVSGGSTVNIAYNAIGNILSKSDVGTGGSFNYTTAQAGCSYYTHNQPHAVRNAGGNLYCYDANGNMTKRQGSTTDWTSYNLPSQINSGSNYSQFSYGPDRQRWKQVANDAGNIETTIYVGGLMEKVTAGSLISWKHYIAGPSGALAIHTRRNNSTQDTFYFTQDHLGSIDSITNSSGDIQVRLSYDSFGMRRKEAGWSGSLPPADSNAIKATSHRGFTYHEMLDNLSVTHMNGRAYDPQLGRFMSSDPVIPDPFNSQAINPYSYVGNNPLRFTDSSGFQPDGPACSSCIWPTPADDTWWQGRPVFTAADAMALVMLRFQVPIRFQNSDSARSAVVAPRLAPPGTMPWKKPYWFKGAVTVEQATRQIGGLTVIFEKDVLVLAGVALDPRLLNRAKGLTGKVRVFLNPNLAGTHTGMQTSYYLSGNEVRIGVNPDVLPNLENAETSGITASMLAHEIMGHVSQELWDQMIGYRKTDPFQARAHDNAQEVEGYGHQWRERYFYRLPPTYSRQVFEDKLTAERMTRLCHDRNEWCRGPKGE